MDDYRALLLGQRKADETAPLRSVGATAEKRQDRKAAADRRRELAPLRNQASAAEKLIERLGDARDRLTAALANPKTHAGGKAVVVELKKQLGQIEKQLAAAEESWLALQEQLETLQAAE
jgi:ATP-binding cassette subfamily F protein 3